MARAVTPANDIPEKGDRTAPDTGALFEVLPHGLVWIDGQACIGRMNPQAEALLGKSRRYALGARLDALGPAGRVLAGFVTPVAGRGTPAHEPALALPSPLDARKTTHVAAEAVPCAGGILLILRAPLLADSLGAEMAGRDTSPAAAMAAVLAHEIKNPLAGIRGAAQLLEGEGSQRLSDIICREVDRIRTLLDRMDRLSDPAPEALAAVNVHAVLDWAAGRISQKGPEIQKTYDPSLPPVLADETLLEQAVQNILDNAAAAAGAGGCITIATRYIHGVSRKDGTGGAARLPIEISMSDTGGGMDEDLLETVFEPFVTRRAGGRGLGLALARKFVHDMGGLIEAGNGEDGAVFRIRLAAAKEEEARG